VKDVLPASVVNRPKSGFPAPVRRWHNALFAAHGDSLRDGYLVRSGILRRESGERLAGGPSPQARQAPFLQGACVGTMVPSDACSAAMILLRGRVTFGMFAEAI